MCAVGGVCSEMGGVCGGMGGVCSGMGSGLSTWLFCCLNVGAPLAVYY